MSCSVELSMKKFYNFGALSFMEYPANKIYLTNGGQTGERTHGQAKFQHINS